MQNNISTEPTPVSTTETPHKTPPSHTHLVLIIIVLVILLIGLGGYFVVIQPKVQLVKHGQQTLKYLPDLRTDINDVSTGIDNIYKLTTGGGNSPSTGEKTLLRLQADDFLSQLKPLNNGTQGEVAGASTKVDTSLEAFNKDVENFYNQIKNNKSFGASKPNVLGETTQLESPRSTLLRKMKQTAQDGSTIVKKADSMLTQLEDHMKTFPGKTTDAQNILTSLDTTNKKADHYLSEAKKTTEYYQKISDIQLELTPLLTSYMTLLRDLAAATTPDIYFERISELDKTMQKISTSIHSIPESELPEAMQPLHSDNVQIVDLLASNIKEVDTTMRLNDFTGFVRAVLTLEQQLEPLITRSISQELNFWQNNKTLKGHGELTAAYKKSETEVDELVNKNKLPVFTN